MLTLIGFSIAASVAHADSLPSIKAHSKLRFAVYKGDSLTVEAQALGDHLEAKWVKDKETFCRAFRCEIDTSNWALGTHKVTFVTYNEKGSLFLRYYVRILAAPAGYKPGKVEPELVTAGEDIEAVRSDELFVHTVTGRGFSYHNKKVQVVGPLPRALEWSERLKAQSGATLFFGRAKSEAHVLGGDSAILLAKTPSGRRAIVLTRGMLRSRQLDAKDPQWSVVVGNWLQVDTDAQGDVVVDNAGDAVTVTVLRGSARVFRRAGEGSEEVSAQGAAVSIAPGLAATFKQDEKGAPRVALPVAKVVGQLVRATTPYYVAGQPIGDELQDQTLLGEKRPASFKEALKLADEAEQHLDHFVAIEALRPFAGEAEQSFAASLVLGRAYAGVFLSEDAFKEWKRAAELDTQASLPRFLIGQMYLGERNWKAALKQLEKAEELGYSDEQLLHYYLGVAKFRTGDAVGARSHFESVLWSEERPEVSESARAFLRKIESTGWLDLRFELGALYDSNVLRAASKALEGNALGITKTKTAGYRGAAGFTAWATRSRTTQVGLGFDIDKTGYLDAKLKKVEPLVQRLGLVMGLAFGGEAGEEPFFALKTTGSVGNVFVGEERALDQIAMGVALGSPALLDLALTVDSVLSLDPLPARDDVYDPVLEEVVLAGERSERQLYYGLALKPVRTQQFQLGLGVQAGGGEFRSALHTAENYKDLRIALDGGWALSMRNKLTMDLAQRQRQFPNATDKRKDTRLSYGVGWRFGYTASLYQVVSAGLESQKSSRSENSYGRQIFGYTLGLSF